MSSQTNQDKPKANPNDPRRDKDILFYDKENIAKISPDLSGGVAEFYQLVSMFIGIYAFMMKIKWAAWCALFFFLTSIFNMKLENKFQQIFAGIGIIIVSFVSVYVQPNPPASVMTPPQ